MARAERGRGDRSRTTPPSLGRPPRRRGYAAWPEIGRASWRKSDWSSDVCSSDLGRIELDNFDREDRRAGGGIRADRNMHAEAVGPAHLQPPIWRERSEVEATGLEQHHPVLAGRRGVADTLLGLRSEERRGGKVTGVQTCALPILAGSSWTTSTAKTGAPVEGSGLTETCMPRPSARRISSRRYGASGARSRRPVSNNTTQSWPAAAASRIRCLA